MQIITGYTGAQHITSRLDGYVHQGIVGKGNYILDVLGKLNFARVGSTNQVKYSDGGVVCIQGRYGLMEPSQPETVTHDNGQTGYNRVDLGVIRLTRDSKGVEKMAPAIIKGAPVISGITPVDPPYEQEDFNDGADKADMLVYRVVFSGLTLSRIDDLRSYVPSIGGLSSGIPGMNIIRGTNSKNNLVPTAQATWSLGGWRTAGANTGGAKTKITVTDCPDQNIEYGWRITTINASNDALVGQDSVPLIAGETYVRGCWARAVGGGSITLRFSYPNASRNITINNSEWKWYSDVFVPPAGNGTVYFGTISNVGTIEICGESLYQGNKDKGWMPSWRDIENKIGTAALTTTAQDLSGAVNELNSNKYSSCSWATKSVTSGAWTDCGNSGTQTGRNAGSRGYTARTWDAGLYFIIPKVSFAGNATGVRGVRLVINDSALQTQPLMQNVGASSALVTYPQMVPLPANSEIRLDVFQTSGAALNVYATVDMYRLGEN